MAEVVVAGATVPEAGGLSQVERVVDTFVTPSKTFRDILRSTSWWLPFVLLVIAAAASAFAVSQKIGFDRVAEMAVQQNSKSADRMAELAPDQRAAQMRIATVFTKDLTYAGGVFVLIIVVIAALLNWASMNFGFGARTTFGQNFAVVMYATLPLIFWYLLNVVLVYAGVNTENFDLKNPVGTNLGYYVTDSPLWIRTALSFFDIFRIWSLVLSVIGTAIIAKKTIAQAAIVVVGWWIISVLLVAGITAASS
jgi:hypothetical protein